MLFAYCLLVIYYECLVFLLLFAVYRLLLIDNITFVVDGGGGRFELPFKLRLDGPGPWSMLAHLGPFGSGPGLIHFPSGP